VSATNANVASREIVTPFGIKNWAMVPVPSHLPLAPSPAIVVTILVEISIFRIMLFVESATNEYVPSGELQIPKRFENSAFVPTPFVSPINPEPTKVVTVAVEIIIFRIF
jgi:hypothetical protein